VTFIKGAVIFIGKAIIFIGGAVMFIGKAITFIGRAIAFINKGSLAIRGRLFKTAEARVVDNIKGANRCNLRR
jgi:hypothetical protein